jgi:hypothetical protein
MGLTIPVKAEPLHGFQDGFGGLRGRSLPVRIFDAKEEEPSLLSGEQPIEKRRPCATDVKITRWARRKSSYYLCIVHCEYEMPPIIRLPFLGALNLTHGIPRLKSSLRSIPFPFDPLGVL